MRDFSDDLAALRKRLTEAEGYLDLAGSLATRDDVVVLSDTGWKREKRTLPYPDEPP